MTRTTSIDVRLKEFCTTPRQAEYIDAVNEHKGVMPAAAALGIAFQTISEALSKIRARAAAQGYVPQGRPTTHKYTAKMPGEGKRIMVLMDVQAKPGVDFSYLMREGQYAVEKKPDVIVCIGDFADMPSLSGYDKGKRSFEGRRYKRDIEAAHWAMGAFMSPIADYNAAHPTKPYKPRLVFTLGNHEERINRATNEDPKLDGVLSIKDLQYEDFGWDVYPFLEVVMVEGIAFSHYFTTGQKGNPASTARAQLLKKHCSCIAGHQQGLQIATDYRADGALLTSIISGSNYEHDEDYLGPQGNNHWRGFLMLHDVCDGVFDLMPVSLKFINRRYPHITAPTPNYSMPTAAELQAGRV